MITKQAAEILGISKPTLLRWISSNLIQDVKRDQRGWRIWVNEDLQRVKRFVQSYKGIKKEALGNFSEQFRHNRVLSIAMFRGDKYKRMQKEEKNE